ncbi:hypothetical protein DBR17_17890 [Sphingomonas sp. HMWF008]|nr:hypothetical protein DBR17_17890 [Sphingomonas sp. HMWF008]
MIVRRADPVEIARLARAVELARAVAATMDRDVTVFMSSRQPRVAIPPVASVKRVLLGDVVDWVAFETGLPVDELIGRSRLASYVHARDAVVWIGYCAMKRSLAQVGATLGGRDHCTMSTSRDRAERRIESDPAFRGLIDKLLARLTEAAQ